MTLGIDGVEPKCSIMPLLKSTSIPGVAISAGDESVVLEETLRSKGMTGSFDVKTMSQAQRWRGGGGEVWDKMNGVLGRVAHVLVGGPGGRGDGGWGGEVRGGGTDGRRVLLSTNGVESA
jgi:hypothetical protein